MPKPATALPRLKPLSRKALAWTGGVVAGLAAMVLVLGLLDWNLLKHPVERIASASTGRVVKIDGNLRVHLLSWTPGAEIEGLHISNPAWVPGGGDFVHIDRLEMKVQLLPLFRGRVIMPLVQADQPNIVMIATADGSNNWTFHKAGQPQNAKPASLPPIQRFEIRNGLLHVDDAKRQLTFDGTINSSEVEDGANVEAFRLAGQGKLNREDFSANVTGGPLLNVDVTKPYPFGLDLHAGQSHIVAYGVLSKPFDLGGIDTRLDISGPDLEQLYALTGLTLPNTPPYQLTGRLVREGNQFTYSGLNGWMGASDLHGVLGVKTGGVRPLLTAELRSDALVFEDLATVLGGAPSKQSPKSPDQAVIAKTMAANQRLLPDAPLKVDRLRVMDARVRFAATRIISHTLPVTSGSATVVLDNGLLTVDPLVFGLSQGRVTGKLALNARQATPAVDLDLKMSGAQLNQFIPASFSSVASSTLSGRAKLSARGASVREAAAHANGQVSVVGSHGEVRDLLAQALGVNVVRTVGLLLSKKDKRTDLNCIVADFRAQDGVLTAQTLMVDTGPTLVRGSGQINLKTEALDLTVKGDPKTPQLIRLSAPVAIEGRLARPRLRLETGQALGQTGLGVAAATILNPLAALIPFIDAGDAKDNGCAAAGVAAKPAQTAAR